MPEPHPLEQLLESRLTENQDHGCILHRVPLPILLRRADPMGMAAPVYWTADMVRALPDDGNKYECVYGELLVSPSPRPWHEVVLMRLHWQLDSYLHREPVGLLLGPLGDISWSPDTLVQPDRYVVTMDEMRALDWAQIKTLLLAVEVLSPSSTRADRFTKRRLYQDIGIPLYWIVDADAHEVEVWTPEVPFPTIDRERLVWEPAGARTPCVIDLAELFKPL